MGKPTLMQEVNMFSTHETSDRTKEDIRIVDGICRNGNM